MYGQAHTAALQALASIDLHDAIYVACPITSGRRELDLMLALSQFDRDALRREHPVRWKREVLEANKAKARLAVATARHRYPVSNVINPAEFEIDGLDQADYDALCAEIIRCHVGRLVFADGWQYSRGARKEARLAIELSLRMETQLGRALCNDEVNRYLESPPTELAKDGFPMGPAQELFSDSSLVPERA